MLVARAHPSSCCREAQDDGEFAHALWLCCRCGQAMAALGSLRCAGRLAEQVNALYEDTIARLETALQACCAEFKPGPLCKVTMFGVHGHIMEHQGTHGPGIMQNVRCC